MAKKKDLLDEAIEREFEGAYKEGASDEERKTRLESMNQMYRTKVDREAAEEQKKNNRQNIVVRVFSTAVTVGFTFLTFMQGLHFEETGRPTSVTFKEARSFAQRLVQKNNDK